MPQEGGSLLPVLVTDVSQAHRTEPGRQLAINKYLNEGPDPSGGDPNKESPAKGYLAELQTLVLFEPAIPLLGTSLQESSQLCPRMLTAAPPNHTRPA